MVKLLTQTQCPTLKVSEISTGRKRDAGVLSPTGMIIHQVILVKVTLHVLICTTFIVDQQVAHLASPRSNATLPMASSLEMKQNQSSWRSLS